MNVNTEDVSDKNVPVNKRQKIPKKVPQKNNKLAKGPRKASSKTSINCNKKTGRVKTSKNGSTSKVTSEMKNKKNQLTVTKQANSKEKFKFERHLGTEQKIHLANEVALAQLVKEKPSTESLKQEDESDVIEIVEEKPIPRLTKIKRQRKTKSSVAKDDTVSVDIEELPMENPSPLPTVQPVKRKPRRLKQTNINTVDDAPGEPEVQNSPKTTNKTQLTKRNLRNTKTNKNCDEADEKKDTTAPMNDKNEIGPRKRVRKTRVSTSTPSSALLEGETEGTVTDKTTDAEVNKTPARKRGRPKSNNSPIKKLTPPKKKIIYNQSKLEDHQPPISSSSSDTLSWIKDISLSSETSTSHNLVCFNGKLPVVEIVDCKRVNKDKRKRKKEPVCTVTSVTSKFDESTNTVTEKIILSSDTTSESTSITSYTPSKCSQRELIENFKSALNRCDLVFLEWLGDVVDADTCSKDTVVQEAAYVALKEEVKATELCKNIRSLSDTTASENSNKTDEKPSLEMEETTPDAPEINPSRTPEIHDNGESHRLWDDVMATRNIRDSSDDDDALSIFAESINFDTSKPDIAVRSTPVPIVDKTIFKEPETVLKEPIVNEVIPHNQVPTVIRKKIVIPSVPTVIKSQAVCEKQNADSTSINNAASKQESVNQHSQYRPKPIEPVEPLKAFPYKGFCFFNVASNNCNKKVCRFPHTIPSLHHVKSKLSQIDDYHFNKEYLMIKQFPLLKKRYFEVYVAECQKRNLTKLLLEMAYDSIGEETSVMETTLTHLNVVDLDSYKDQLVQVKNGQCLCDELMKTIAYTQNFGRFKPVFIKLTDFMVSTNRPFHIDVATNIFERICILPFESRLSQALNCIIKNTSVTILENSFMNKYLSILIERDQPLYADLIEYKQRVKPETFHVQENHNCLNNGLRSDTGSKRYTSPDTTRLDGMHQKPVEEMQITRSVDFTHQRRFTNCAPPPSIGNHRNMKTQSPFGEDMPLRRPHTDQVLPSNNPFIRRQHLGHLPRSRGVWMRGNVKAIHPPAGVPMAARQRASPPDDLQDMYTTPPKPSYY